MNNINVLKPKFRTNEILDSIRDCLDKGWSGMGYKTDEFEEAWKSYTKLKNAHFINSATSGLHLALKVYKDRYEWQEGDEIITTPLTFVSTNHAIMYENLKPIFTDVDEFLCLDPVSVEKNITNKTKAVIFVGIGGNAGKLDVIAKICKKHNLKLILDAAHMAGTYVKENVHVGNEADVSIFSFQAVKNLPTADSGMICFQDKIDDDKARKLSWLGIDKNTYSRSVQGTYKWKYNVEDVGFKYHGNSIMAAIGLVQLKYLDEDNAYRRQLANMYKTNLNGIDYINQSEYTYKTSQHLFQIKVNKDRRDDLIHRLYKNNIYPGVHYIDNTLYKMYNYGYGSCSNAHQISEQLITLPIHVNLHKDDIDYIIEKVNNG